LENLKNPPLVRHRGQIASPVRAWKRQVQSESLGKMILSLFKNGEVLDFDDIAALLYSKYGFIFDVIPLSEFLTRLARSRKLRSIGKHIYSLSHPQIRKKGMKPENERAT